MKFRQHVWGLAVASLLGGCSVVSDFNECSAGSECASGVCDNGICADTTTCTSASECADTEICVRGACIALKAGCTAAQALENRESEMIYVGSLMPLSGRNAEKGQATDLGVTVAFAQVNQSANGVNGAKIGQITCDTLNDVEVAVEQGNYLSTELGLAAVIGSISSSETLAVAQQVTVPGDTLLISPASTAPSITAIDSGKDLVFRTIPSDVLQAPALASLIEQRGYASIAVLAVNSTYGEGLLGALLTALPPSATQTDVFKTLRYDVQEGSLVTETLVEDATQLFVTEGFAPEAIVVLGSVEGQQLIFALDSLFATDNAPDWVLTDAARDAGLLDAAKFGAVHPRIVGTSPQSTQSPQFQQFQVRYEGAGAFGARDFPFADRAYDAAMLVALALNAVDTPADTNGTALSGVLKRVSSGAQYEASGDLLSASATLRNGDSIDYLGASGAVDFDAAGDVKSAIESWTIEEGKFVSGAVLIDADGNLP
ncbi:MAG: ABC transporter substrate-binding protein [bacterium]